jgi:hypothetical protein
MNTGMNTVPKYTPKSGTNPMKPTKPSTPYEAR